MDQIDQVRRKVDIVELISSYGVVLKKAGRSFKALCPFHEEKTPSFMVSPERQIFKCFGCGEAGDVYGFLMKKEGMEFGEALRMLADRVGVELTSFRPSESQKLKERFLEINHLASEYYHYVLMEHKSGKKALQYLQNRGISKSLMKMFKLGYAPGGWESLVGFLVKKKGYKVNELEQAGLVIRGKRSYYDRFRERIMFSLWDEKKRVVGFAGRVLEKDDKQAKYMNTPETLVYHKSRVLYGLETTKDEIKKANKVVVVEGELDAISSYKAGVKNVVAIKGSALTEEQVELISRFTDNVALALDEDTAGAAAALRGIETAEKRGINVRVIRVKYGKDPDECVQKSTRLWKDSVKEAMPVYDFIIETAVKRYGVKTPEGKRKVSDEVSKKLATISNEVIKDHYIKKLAKLLEVDEAAVIAETEKAVRGRELSQPVRGEIKPKAREERLEEYVLALILQRDSEVKRLVEKIDEKVFSEAAVKKVIEKLKQWFKKGNKWAVDKFVKSLPAELGRQVDEAYLQDLTDLGTDEDKLEKEMEEALVEMKKIAVKEKMREVSSKIKEAEKKGDKKALEKWKRQFVEMGKGLKS